MEVKPLQKPLGRRSVTLGLLAVGAALSSGVMVDRVAPQLITTVRNLIVMPGLTLVFCLWLALDPLPTAMAVLFMALPIAATSCVMARASHPCASMISPLTETASA